MLGQLRMSVDECITAYIQLSSRGFQKEHVMPVTIRDKVKARYSSKKLQRAIEDVVEAQHLDKDALLRDTKPASLQSVRSATLQDSALLIDRRFVCATSKGVSRTFLLRSYPPTREGPELYNSTKIWEAGRATSAASSFFEPIAIGPLCQEFLDGGTGANCPIRQLWKEAAEAFCDGSSSRLQQSLRTIVSIGTGVPDLEAFGDDPLSISKTLLAIATEAQTTADDFHQTNSDLDDDRGRYYRFNVGRGLAGIGLDEASEARRIEDLADAYLMLQSTISPIRKCARALGGPIVSAPPNQYQSMSSMST
jgi:hypothetical protein